MELGLLRDFFIGGLGGCKKNGNKGRKKEKRVDVIRG